jgi:hypothetical protein
MKPKGLGRAKDTTITNIVKNFASGKNSKLESMKDKIMGIEPKERPDLRETNIGKAIIAGTGKDVKTPMSARHPVDRSDMKTDWRLSAGNHAGDIKTTPALAAKNAEAKARMAAGLPADKVGFKNFGPKGIHGNKVIHRVEHSSAGKDSMFGELGNGLPGNPIGEFNTTTQVVMVVVILALLRFIYLFVKAIRQRISNENKSNGGY